MEVFIRVAKLASFSAAARELNLSTTAVSRYVKELENWLGVRLLNRTTRKLSLTEVGAAYLQRSASLVSEAEELEQSIRDLQANPVGMLKLSASTSLGADYIAPLLPDFMRQHPRLIVELFLADRFVDLVDEGFDLAIRITTDPEPGLIARKLASCSLACVASPAYLQHSGVPQVPNDLTQHNCIIDRNLKTESRWLFNNSRGQPQYRKGQRQYHRQQRRSGAYAGDRRPWRGAHAAFFGRRRSDQRSTAYGAGRLPGAGDGHLRALPS